jgi:RHS repeat-associated protein
MTDRKRLCLATAVIFSLFINFSYVISVASADPLSIGYTSRQMSVSGSDSSQSLTASGGSGSYTWSIPGGSGSLSNSGGSSTVYTAPSSNANCANNPTVRLMDSSGQYVDLPMAVNGYSSAGTEAVRISGDSWCNSNGIISECGMTTYHYNCHGDLMGLPYYHNPNPCNSVTNSVGKCDNCLNSSNICDNCSTYCGTIQYKMSISPEDRTLPFPYLRNGGCCPANAPPQTGPNDTGTGCSGSPANPNVNAGSSGNIKSGNLYESLDVAGLTLSYNSMGSIDLGILGRMWTHNYNVTLTALSDNATLVLKTADGNIIYFRLSGGVYYPEPRSGDTSRIVKNLNGTYTRTMKNGTIYQFNSYGYLTSITDRNSKTTTFTYNSNSYLTSITDLNGRVTTVTSDTGGKITSITDPGGMTHSLAYSGYSSYLLISVTDPVGNVWSYTYNGNVLGQMHTKTDPAGKTTTYTYDAKGMLLTSTDPENKTRSMNYTQAGTTAFTEKDGSIWTYKYDPTYAVKTEKTDPLGNTTRYAYDLNRNLISTTDPNGGVTTYTYDSNSNLTSVTDALGHTTSYTYNSMNLVASVTDARNVVTAYDYDVKGNLIKMTDPLGAATVFQYDTRGNVTTITDAKGQKTILAYDTKNNLTGMTDPLGKTTTFTYDAVGNRLTMTDPLGNSTHYAYNSINQMTQITDPKGNITQFTYDYKGNVLRTTDANGNPTAYAYNYRGQVTQTTDALNNLTKMSYGPAGCGGGCGGADKLAALTDALNHSTQYKYDLAGRLIKETDPLGKEIHYTYDGKGNLITKTKADGKAVIYAYDANSRLIRKQYSDGTITQYRYDANGNMTYAGNTTIAYNFTYDAANRLTALTDSNNRSVQYQYDTLGNKAKMITPEGKTIRYAYDAAKRLTALTTDKGAFSLIYDADGGRSKLTYPNRTTAAYTYDPNGNLTRIRHTGPNGTVITEANYTYDNANNRLTKTDIEKTETYSYDPVYRLTKSSLSVKNKPSKLLPRGEAYVYDSVGNRLHGPEQIDAMSYDEANELLSLDTTQYHYDANGNRIQKIETGHRGNIKTASYTYDDENRLTKVEIQKGHRITEVSFTYNPLGRRISKTVHREEIRDGKVHDLPCPRTIYYVYDGSSIIMEYMKYKHREEVTARYIHGLGIDEPLSVEKEHNEFYYYHADGLGSIVGLTDTRGRLIQSYAYDSFGNMKPHLSRIGQPYTYTAREYDPETGLYFYRARYYDSKVGRFLQRDPIGFKGGDANLYNYVRSNPTNKIDPLGLKGCGPFGIHIGDPWGLKPCCDDHDDCYEDCKDRSDCDKNFCSCLESKCSLITHGSREKCNGRARFYCNAVTYGGWIPYYPCYCKDMVVF